MAGSKSALNLLRVKLFTRRNCALCDEFVDALEASFPRQLDITVCDVDACDDWRKQFGNDVPVLTNAEGRLICQHFFDKGAVREVLNTVGQQA